MKTFRHGIVFLPCVCMVCAFVWGYPAQALNVENDVAEILSKNCTTVGCHAGPYPAMGMNLEPESFRRSLLNVYSQEQKELRLVDTKNPEKSYMLMKIRGDDTIVGKRMPLNARPLSEDAIKLIQEWILNLPEEETSAVKAAQPSGGSVPANPAFWGPQLMNLATPTSIGNKHVLFRISHRFYPSVQEGYDVFYGLNGPASIYLSLGYGLTDNMDLLFGHSNRFHEWVLTYKWRFFSRPPESDLPISAAVKLASTWVTEQRSGTSVFSRENLKFNVQFSLALAVHENVSLLVVPAYASNVNHWEENSEGTLALGTGGRFHLGKEISLLFEIIPVLAGYHAKVTGWGLGIEKKIGGHVFQIYVLNSVGITGPQYLPGGDLCLNDGDFRFGFNIFRWF